MYYSYVSFMGNCNADERSVSKVSLPDSAVLVDAPHFRAVGPRCSRVLWPVCRLWVKLVPRFHAVEGSTFVIYHLRSNGVVAFAHRAETDLEDARSV